MESKYVEILEHLREDGFDYHKAISTIQGDLTAVQNNCQEQQANMLWAIKTVVEIYQGFVDVYDLLQQSKFYEAWCKAEEVEITCNNLKRNFLGIYTIVKDLYECITRLQSLYPYRIFSSHVIKIKKVQCSVCNKIRNIRHDCGHRRGYVYDGVLCCDIVKDFELKGLDIVYNPVHKYAVLFTTDKNDKRVDNYDYTLVKALMQFWKKPFQRWFYDIKHIHKPVSDFPGLSDDDDCPCGSGKKYLDCCKSNPKGVKHKVYQFKVEQIN